MRIKPELIREIRAFVFARVLTRAKSNYPTFSFSHHEWEDMAEDIFLHVLRKWKQYDKKRDWKPWVSQIIHRKMFNKIKDHIVREKRYGGRMRRLLTQTRQENIWDEQVVEYEPDVAYYQDRGTQLARAMDSLEGQSRELVETFRKAKTWQRARKMLKITYNQEIALRRQIRQDVLADLS